MAGHKTIMTSQMYREKGLLSMIHGNEKAAKIAGSLLPENRTIQHKHWSETLHMYYDYFIRY